MNKESNKKRMMILTIILWVLLIGLCGWMVYDKLSNNEEESKPSGGNTSAKWKVEDYYGYKFVDENGNVIEVDNDYLNKINDRYLAIETNFADDALTNTAYLFDVNKKKIVLKEEDTIDDAYLYAFRSLDGNDNYIGLEYKCQGSCSDYFDKIYSSEAKLISDSFNYYAFDKNNNLLLLENDVIKTYNEKGELLNQNSDYKNVVFIDKDYIVYEDNNDIKLIANGDVVTVVSGIKAKNITEAYIYSSVLTLRVVDKSVTVNDLWNYCTNVDEETCRGFEKEDLKSLDLGYLYEYNIATKELDKHVDIADPWD